MFRGVISQVTPGSLKTTGAGLSLAISQLTVLSGVKPNKKGKRKINKVHVLPGLLWKGLLCRWPDAQPRAGVWLQWDKRIFQNREKGGLPKLRSKSSLPWELTAAERVPGLEPFKNGRNSCRPKHTQENKPTTPSPAGFSEASWSCPPA